MARRQAQTQECITSHHKQTHRHTHTHIRIQQQQQPKSHGVAKLGVLITEALRTVAPLSIGRTTPTV